MPSQKILQINKLYSPWIGGVETHVRQLSEELAKQGQDVTVLCCNTKLKTERETLQNVKIIRAGSFGIFFSMPVSLMFFYLLKKTKADILHFHLPNPLAVLAYLLVRPSGKVIVTWHADIIRQKIFLWFLNPFINSFLKKADQIITTSPNMIESSTYLKKNQHKTTVIPLSIHLKDYEETPKTNPLTERIRSEESPFILFMGRLVYYKGILTLIEALKGTNIKLIVIGNGPLKDQVKTEITSFFPPDQIQLIPPQPFSTVLAYLHACDFLVLPSTCNSEAFGIVQLEAMACKKPVISTNLPTGVPYVNQDQQTGIIVEPQNVADLKQALLKLSANKTLQKQMGEKAYQRVKDLFQVSKMIDEILKIYKKSETDR